MIAISIISVTLLLILAAIVTYHSVNNLLRWKKIEMDTAKGRVFLDKSFLKTNFKINSAVVGLVFIHLYSWNMFSSLDFQCRGFLMLYFSSFLVYYVSPCIAGIYMV